MITGICFTTRSVGLFHNGSILPIWFKCEKNSRWPPTDNFEGLWITTRSAELYQSGPILLSYQLCECLRMDCEGVDNSSVLLFTNWINEDFGKQSNRRTSWRVAKSWETLLRVCTFFSVEDPYSLIGFRDLSNSQISGSLPEWSNLKNLNFMWDFLLLLAEILSRGV